MVKTIYAMAQPTQFKGVAYEARNATNMAAAYALGDGKVFWMEGVAYRTNYALTGTASVANDLSQDGIEHIGSLMPEHFGVAGDGSNEGAKLQAMFDYIGVATKPLNINFGDKTIITTQQHTLTPAFPIFSTGRLDIQAASDLGADSTLLSIRNASRMNGALDLKLVGGSGGNGEGSTFTWANRFVDTLLTVDNSRHCSFERLTIWGARVHGLDYSDQGGDIASFPRFRWIDVVDCGMRIGDTTHPDYPITAQVESGSSSAQSQTTTLTVTGTLPSITSTVMLASVGGQLALVNSIDPATNTVVIGRWIEGAKNSAIGENLRLSIGGGVNCVGNDVNVGSFDVRATRCAIPFVIGASYSTALSLYAQHCDVPFAAGTTVQDAINGICMTNTGGELSCEFGPAIITQNVRNAFLQGYPLSQAVDLFNPMELVDGDNVNNKRYGATLTGWAVMGERGIVQPVNPLTNWQNATPTNNIARPGAPEDSVVHLREKFSKITLETNDRVWEEQRECRVEIIRDSTSYSGSGTWHDLEINLSSSMIADGWTHGFAGEAFDAIVKTVAYEHTFIRVTCMYDPTAKTVTHFREVSPAVALPDALTDSSTGTAGTTVSDVGATYDQATINDNLATLSAQIEAVRAHLEIDEG